jgi:hypothetical protein
MKSTLGRLRLIPILFSVLALGAVVLFTLTRVRSVEAQSCDDIPQGSGESITANISVRDTGQPVSDKGLVPSSTWIAINALPRA